MGLLSKLKGAVNSVTGGAAKVTVQFDPQTVKPGEEFSVRVTMTSTGNEVKSKGVFIDLQSMETIDIARNTANNDAKIEIDTKTHEQSFLIAPAFVLGAGETQTFEGLVTIPLGIEPSYRGEHASHKWELRGRLDAVGNDPDSGFVGFRVEQ